MLGTSNLRSWHGHWQNVLGSGMLKRILDISGERRTYPQNISINEEFFFIGIYSVNPLSIQKQCNYCQIDCCHTSKWQVDVVRGTTDWSTSASASFYVPWCWVRHANICALVTSWVAQLSPYWGWSSIHNGFIYTHFKHSHYGLTKKTIHHAYWWQLSCFFALPGFFPHEQGDRQSVPGAPLLGTVLASGARFPGSCHTLFDGGTSFGKRHHCPIHQCCQGRYKSRVLFNSLVNHDFQWELSIHSLYRSLVGRSRTRL